ncbi:MAG: 2-hydroxyacid dehydrogenase [Clostridiales bacterium]|nr:2-hydroxyacid dehydrogenase [Clostridiales bacterium]
MLNTLTKKPQNIVLVGDAFVSPDTMEAAVRSSKISIGKISKAYWGTPDKSEFAERQLNIERHGAEAEAWADGLEQLMEDCTVLVTHFNPVPAALIEKAPNLKAILTCRGGLEHIDLNAANNRGIPVVNVIRNAIPVAEFALGLILSVTRNISTSHHLLIDGKWEKVYPNSEYTSTLSNMTVGLIGIGNIGIELAVRLKALGVSLIAFDEYISKERLERNGLADIKMVGSMEELFSTADIISLHLRLTPETEGIINKKYFDLMKPTAYFINTSRGGLVNQADLIDTLKNHRIAGAALDVFDKEPLPENSGFSGLDNVVITPHIAGATVDAIPMSPYLLMRETDKIIEKGLTDRIVNFDKIKGVCLE